MSEKRPETEILVKLIDRLDDCWYPDEDKEKTLKKIHKWFNDEENQPLVRTISDLTLIPTLLSEPITEEKILVARQLALNHIRVYKYKVYRHTSPDSKVYIGITCQDLDFRWQSGHGYVKNKPFYEDISKYGWDNFSHDVLYSDLDEIDAYRIEEELIASYKSYDLEYGYNLDKGGKICNIAPKIWEYDYSRQDRGRRSIVKVLVPSKELDSCYATIKKWGNQLIDSVELQSDLFENHYIVRIRRNPE